MRTPTGETFPVVTKQGNVIGHVEECKLSDTVTYYLARAYYAHTEGADIDDIYSNIEEATMEVELAHFLGQERVYYRD